MVASENQLSMDIRPIVGISATYRRLSGKLRYATAEFVDNSTRSYYGHQAERIGTYKLKAR